MSSSDGVARTKILLLGLRRSGKTSIQKVLFNSMVPKETFFLDATMRIVKHTYDTVIPLEIWDCPGNITVETLGSPLSIFSTLVFVIDIRDLYNQPISRLVEFIAASYTQNPSLNFEILVHKAEKLNEDEKIENFRQINERVMDRLFDVAESVGVGPSAAGMGLSLDSQGSFMEYVEQQMTMNFHLTSIFDHSLHQAFSIVLQRLIDSLPYVEELLNSYCANSQASKAFLFDAKSRLYVATDASPVDTATHNLCCDNLAMLNAFGALYRSASASPARRRRGNPEPHPSSCLPPDLPATPPPSAASFNGKQPMGLPPSSPSSSAPSSRARSPPSKSPAPSSRTPSRTQTSASISNNHLHPPNSSSSSSSSSSSLSQPSYPHTHPNSTSKSSSPTSIIPNPSSNSTRIQTPQDLFYPSGATSIHPSSLPSTSFSSPPGSMSGMMPIPGTTIMWHLLTAPGLIVEELGLSLSRGEGGQGSSSSHDNGNGHGKDHPFIDGDKDGDGDGKKKMAIVVDTGDKSKSKAERTLTSSSGSAAFQTYPNPTLVLLVLLPTSVFETRRGLVELNVVAVREGVQEIVDVEREVRGTRR